MNFDEMDKLLEMTNEVSAMSVPEQNTENTNDDDTLYADLGMPGDKFGSPDTITKIAGTGSSNVSTDKEPLFEKTCTCGECEECNSKKDEIIECGLGLGFKRAFKAQSFKGECCCGNSCTTPYSIGDCIAMSNEQIPVIFIIKDTCGDMLTCAKPTSNQAEYSISTDGQWPEYHFHQDSVKPMQNISINDIARILRFNDAQMESFDGSCTDSAPKETADERTLDAMITKANEKLDDLDQRKAYMPENPDEYDYTVDQEAEYEQPTFTAGYRGDEYIPGGYQHKPDTTVGYRVKWGD